MFTAVRLGVLFLTTAVGSVAAQPGADTDTRSDDPRIVTIRGCVEGVLLTVTDLPAPQAPGVPTTVGYRFRVVGDRELIAELREYSGHEVDLVGVLSDEPDRRRRPGPGGSIGGRTRIWIGVNSSREAPRRPFAESGDAAGPAEVEMRAVIPVNATCPI